MQTVVGVFDNRVDAAKALDILIDSGFDSDHVQLQGRPFVSEPPGQPPDDERSEGFLGTMSTFFSRLFGEHDTLSPRVYDEAVRRGNFVVTVDASDEEEAEEVEHLLDDAGAIDIDEHVDRWRSEGWDAGRAATPGAAASDRPHHKVPWHQR